MGIRRRPFERRRVEGGGADLAERDVLGHQVVGELAGQAQAEASGLAVDDEAGDAGVGEVLGDLVGAGERVVAVGGAAVGDDDQQRAATRVADVLEAQRLGGLEQALGQRRASAGGQLVEPGGGDVDRGRRRQRERRPRRRGT